MTRSGFFAAAVAMLGIAVATPAEAQLRPWEISIAGGPSFPMSDLKDQADTGYHVEGSVGFDVPMLPFGIRADAFWQEFPDSDDGWFRQIGGILNATAGVPMAVIQPYVLAGVGYLRTETPNELDDAESGVGVNAGAGIDFPFMGLGGFLEARYMNLLGSDEVKMYRSIPVTVGIRF